jgi:hypothetical protein
MNGRKIPPTGAELHRRWLELVDADGPFLAVPALKRVWPQGMPQPDGKGLAAVRDARPAFEKAWDRWDSNRDDKAATEDYRRARDAWVNVILRDVLGWKTAYVTGADAAGTANQAAASALAAPVRSPDRSVTVRPTGALVHRDTVGALVLVIDPVDSLRDPLADGWAASPIDRMELLLRKADVKIGVVTDGCWWAIVSARPQTMLASGITSALTWTESPATRNAFIELLRRIRLIGGTEADRLTELFKDSVAAAEEITEALGTQVRRAVELLVQALSEGALDARRRGHPDPLPADRDEVYQAAVTVLMRLVFLLFAEERGLLPQGALFTAGYGISDVLDDLDERVSEEGIEALDATHLTWHRLLATSRALYEGATFEDVTLPSYGGSLFDPARYPFLTACDPHGTLTITVSDRVMVEALRAVQVARLRGQPARRISFRDIDVEQIGYIYEGLLGYSCADVKEVTVGLIGKEGEEPEIPLSALEALRAGKPADAAFADAILAWVKEHQTGATPPTKAALAKALKAQKEQIQIEDAERTLRSLTTDPLLRDRLRPFIGIIRRDLRNRPLVVVRGGVLVVETPSRATAGAHYTPKSLAEDVVKYALEPLVYDPGPHQRVDGWVPVDSDRILDLRVADIACGSGAFLVAAARYLADRLVEAWQRERAVTGIPPHELKTHAIRTVIASCLYGADINAMAVEMCKLSLWLVSLDPKLPFSFVDDKVLHGNALLGLTDVRQLKRQHIDPDAAGAQPSLYEVDVDGVLRRATRLRRQLATEVNDSDPQRSAMTKRRQWRDYQALTAPLCEIADAIIATGLKLGGKPGRPLNVAYENLSIAIGMAYDQQRPDRTMLENILKTGLTPTVSTDYDRWKPLHWILTVPDVMERGGFDAIIGNPPFLGGKKVTAALGTNIRDWFVNILTESTSGNADLVAYFFLRAMSLLTRQGNLGLIATNTVAQGDTRQVGLDQLVKDGLIITRAIQSRSWPAANANLEFAAVWGTRDRAATAVPRVADGILVEQISALLEPVGRVDGQPVRLIENAGIAFQGCIILGKGFIIDDPDEAAAWIVANQENTEVLFPYLNGEDLNSRPDSSAPRWVIDFNDRSESEAQAYRLPFAQLVNLAKPERATKAKAVREAPWWLFWRARPAMRKAIRNLDEVLVIALVSKAVMPMRVSSGQVFSHALGVFATDSFADQAVLSSSMHQMWAIKYGSTLETRSRYTPSDVFDTFPRPRSTDWLAEIGRTVDPERREIMQRRDLGLTRLYNLVNDPDTPDSVDADIARLRQVHVELDRAVMDAYGWGRVELDHGFHTYRQMTRWTVSPVARLEILDRLLQENHDRAAAQGEAPPPADTDDEGDEE